MTQFFNRTLYNPLLNPIQDWLASHPTLNWLLQHPVVFGSLVAVLLLLFAGLLSAIAHLTENLWIRLLRLPLQLVWLLIQATSQLFRYGIERLSKSSVASLDTALEAAQTRSPHTELQSLLRRLDQLQQEEAEVVQKIKQLVQAQDAGINRH